MNKTQLQSCLTTLLSWLGLVPSMIVYIIVLNKVEVESWVWALYIFGMLWTFLFGAIIGYIQLVSANSTFKEVINNAIKEMEEKYK